MRLVEFKYDDRTTGWLNPANVAEVAPRKVNGKPTGRSAVYYAGCVDENHCTWAADDPATLAARIEAALREEENVEKQSGKEEASPSVVPSMQVAPGMWSTPVPMCTISSKEYRKLLEDGEDMRRMIATYMEEGEKLKDALAKAHAKNYELERKLKEQGGAE